MLLQLRITLVILLSIIGIGLMVVQTDRQTITLLPTAGAVHAVQAQKSIVVTFTSNRSGITRFGVYLTSSAEHLPPVEIPLSFTDAKGKNLGNTSIPSAAIDNERATQWRFASPVANKTGEKITATITLPEQISNFIKIKTHPVDETFDASSVSLVVDNTAATERPAYEVYSEYHPALALQVGGLLILAALYLLAINIQSPAADNLKALGVAVALSFLATLPAFMLGGKPYLLVVTQALAFYSAYQLLRLTGYSSLVSTVGAIVFGFTSWFALQITVGRTLYALVAGLPLLGTLKAPIRKTWIGWAMWVVVASMAAVTFTESAYTVPPTMASFRDIFLDPNQTQYSIKTQNPNVTWDHFGAYIGIIPLVLAIIAILQRRPNWKIISSLVIVCAAITLTPSIAHLLILPLWLLSLLATQGFERLRHFLGTQDSLIQFLLGIVCLIILLDLWQVLTPIIEYPLL